MIDDRIAQIFKAHGRERLGGASGRGWSRIALYQACPRKFYLSQVANSVIEVDENGIVEYEEPMPLQVGSLFHTLLALYYSNMMGDGMGGLTPEAFVSEWLEVGGSGPPMLEANRIFGSYMTRYEEDYLTPLAVEYHVEDPKTKNTCRYDLVAKVEGATGLPNGIYAVEHKSASRLRDGELWRHDGEIVGEAALWGRAKLSEKFLGDFRGVLVNVVSKEKAPKFSRIWVSPSESRMESHMLELALWEDRIHASMDAFYVGDIDAGFPKARSACVSKHGMCPFYEECNL